jgi:hypothetical protein
MTNKRVGRFLKRLNIYLHTGICVFHDATHVRSSFCHRSFKK